MINMIELIGAILTSAIRNLFDQQPDVLKNTSRTGMTEWNFGHHLANEIAKYIFWLNHDMDVMKRNYNNRRPDIIFHKRGSNGLNYLVIEIKCNNSTSGDRTFFELPGRSKRSPFPGNSCSLNCSTACINWMILRALT